MCHRVHPWYVPRCPETLRCKHCLSLLVSLFSFVLPNACSPLRTNFSFVFRQETKWPNVFAIRLARAKITKKMAVPTCMVSHLNRLGTKIPGLLSEYTIQCWQKYPKSLCLRAKKKSFPWKQKAPQHSTITVRTQAERRATLWLLLDYVKKGWAGGNLLVINDGPENGI